MHISDGILPPSITIGTYALTFVISAWSCKKIDPVELPKTAVITSSFFVASLIHVPLGPTSIHLLLPGFVGVLLGPVSFLSIVIGLFLQCLIFQYGGITSLGANALMMGLPALFCGALFQLFKDKSKKHIVIMGSLFSVLGTILSALCLAALLASAGEHFRVIAKIALVSHLPVFVLEGIVSGFAISFLYQVKPELLFRKN